MSNRNDFVIKDGILEKYTGTASNVDVPDGVTGIGDKAFCDCRSLASVRLPDSVKSIGSGAFSQCRKLKNITLPRSLKSIGEEAFRECRSLTSITVPDSVTEICRNAFAWCISLTEVNISCAAADIGDSAFYRCGIESFYYKNKLFEQIPEQYRNRIALLGFAQNYKNDRPSAEIIESYINYFKTHLGNYINYEYITAHTELIHLALDYSVFTAEEAELLLSKLPEYSGGELRALLIEYINNTNDKTDFLSPEYTPIAEIYKNWLFQKNPDGTVTLTKYIETDEDDISPAAGNVICPAIIGGNTVTEIGAEAFFEANVTSVMIPDTVTRIGDSAFSGCEHLTSLFVPDSVTKLGKEVFRGCAGLTSITLSGSMKRLGRGAFADCIRLASITLPDSLTKLSRMDFANCPRLRTVYVGKNTEIADTIFDDCPLVEIIRR